MKLSLFALFMFLVTGAQAQQKLSPEQIESIKIDKRGNLVYTYCDQSGCRPAPVEPSFDRIERLDGAKVLAVFINGSPAIQQCERKYKRSGTRWTEPKVILDDCDALKNVPISANTSRGELKWDETYERLLATGLVQCLQNICVGDRVVSQNPETPGGTVQYITNNGFLTTQNGINFGVISDFKKISATDRICSNAGVCVGDIFEADYSYHHRGFEDWEAVVIKINSMSPNGDGEVTNLTKFSHYDIYLPGDGTRVDTERTYSPGKLRVNLSSLSNVRKLLNCNAGFCVGDIVQPSALVKKVRSRIAYVGKNHVYFDDGRRSEFKYIEKAN